MFAQSKLYFRNKTASVVDSIVLCNTDCRVINTIQPGETRRLEIPFAWENTHGVILCNYKIYFKSNYYTGQRIKGNPVDTIDVEHEPLDKNRFTISIFNTSASNYEVIPTGQLPIDSSFDISPKVHAIVVNYSKFAANPRLVITKHGKPNLVSLIEHNFQNRSDSTDAIWINDSTAFPGPPPFSKIPEFTVALQAPDPKLIIRSIRVKSHAITAILNEPNSTTRVLIFDFEKLRADPKFLLKINGKRFNIRLNENDMAEINYARKFYSVYDNAVKPQ